jgi:hypothetical protein
MLNFFFRFVFFIKVKNEEGNLMSCFFSVKSCFHFYQRFISACVVLCLFIGTSHCKPAATSSSVQAKGGDSSSGEQIYLNWKNKSETAPFASEDPEHSSEKVTVTTYYAPMASGTNGNSSEQQASIKELDSFRSVAISSVKNPNQAVALSLDGGATAATLVLVTTGTVTLPAWAIGAAIGITVFAIGKLVIARYAHLKQMHPNASKNLADMAILKAGDLVNHMKAMWEVLWVAPGFLFASYPKEMPRNGLGMLLAKFGITTVGIQNVKKTVKSMKESRNKNDRPHKGSITTIVNHSTTRKAHTSCENFGDGINVWLAYTSSINQSYIKCMLDTKDAKKVSEFGEIFQDVVSDLYKMKWDDFLRALGGAHTHHSLGYMSAHLISGLVVAGWDLPGLILKHCQVPPVFKESKAPCAAK